MFFSILLYVNNKTRGNNMNPFYVTRSWNNELKKCVYKVAERRWFQLARYLVGIGSLTDQAAEEYQENGYKLERLPREERIEKSKREAMMNNAFNLGYADGYLSKTWAMFLHDGLIQPRDGWQRTYCYRFGGGKTYYDRALGKRGYLLKSYGVRKYMDAIKNLSEYKKQAEIRCAKKNGVEYKEHTIFEEC